MSLFWKLAKLYLACNLTPINAYSSTYINLMAANQNFFNTTKAQNTLTAINTAISSMPTLTTVIRSLGTTEINICNSKLASESQIFVDVTTFSDYYQDLLFNYGFNYIGTKYHTSGNLIFNLHAAVEECIESVSLENLVEVRYELDESLNTVKKSKSYLPNDVDFSIYTDNQESSSNSQNLPLSFSQRSKFETGYQLDLFNRVYRDTWDNKRRVVPSSGKSEAQKISDIQTVLSSMANINLNFTTFNNFERYYNGEAKKWFLSRARGINFDNDFEKLYRIRSELIEAEGYSGFQASDLVGAAEEFRANSLHVSASIVVKFGALLMIVLVSIC